MLVYALSVVSVLNINMEHEAFVYKWTNIDNGKYYIGKHKGTEDDGYVSSGKVLLQVYNANPKSFKRTILFRGTEQEVSRMEQDLIKEAIQNDGHQGIYNLTTWDYLKEWKRTCLHCSSIVDPRNEEWLKVFNQQHFENCEDNPANYNIMNLSKEEIQQIRQELKQRELRASRQRKQYQKKVKTLKELREAE